jgi:hypothetical protein
MGTAIKRIAATQFAFYTSLTSVSSTIGAKFLGGRIAGWMDYSTIYLACAGTQALVIALLPLIRARPDTSPCDSVLPATSGATVAADRNQLNS